MRELVISVTQAARKFSDCVNRVRYQGASFVLQKNGVPVARIVPVESASGCPIWRSWRSRSVGRGPSPPEGEIQVRDQVERV